MAKRISAYKSNSGVIFETEAEANRDDICVAADVVAAAEKSTIFATAMGQSGSCCITAKAILQLAEAVKNLPTNTEEKAA